MHVDCVYWLLERAILKAVMQKGANFLVQRERGKKGIGSVRHAGKCEVTLSGARNERGERLLRTEHFGTHEFCALLSSPATVRNEKSRVTRGF
jgi:hypothetical protein